MSNLLRLLQKFSWPSPVQLARDFARWLQGNWRYWGASAVGHAVAMLLVGLVLGTFSQARPKRPFTFEVVDTTIAGPELTPFNLDNVSLDPSILDTESLLITEPPTQTALHYDDSPDFEEAGGGSAVEDDAFNFGGLGRFDLAGIGPGPIVRGEGGVGTGVGTSGRFGSGGNGEGFAGRGQGHRDQSLGRGMTRETERAVAAGLQWLARHQNANGSWSLGDYHYHCRDKTCTGHGAVEADAAATAMGLLPFFAAGQTHKSDGPYRKNIQNGVIWLLKIQEADGSLSAKSPHLMYSHGLATIALCEAYGMSRDRKIGEAAQKAVLFIERAQHPSTGGWRYEPGDLGDTSVLGWQLMALKSAQMAGLRVSYQSFQGAERFLESVSSGKSGGLFSYTRGKYPTPSMTAVGLLCHQYLRMKSDAPAMLEGSQYLLQNLPNNSERDLYYWYYATQVMINLEGPNWDQWNRHTRRILIQSQDRYGCATGSWDPEEPATDPWGTHGGRLMMTSLATLTLEVYYRYLPLYKIDGKKTAPNIDPNQAQAALAR